MSLIKKLTINSKEYTVTFRRFDDVVSSPYGPEYHGYHLDIQSQYATITARKYDGDDNMSIQIGVKLDDLDLIEDMRQIAKELFGIDKLLLLTGDTARAYRLV